MVSDRTEGRAANVETNPIMKTLPIHTIPPTRMAAMTSRGARELRTERIARVRKNWDGWDETTDGNGGCAFAACLLLALALCTGLFLI